MIIATRPKMHVVRSRTDISFNLFFMNAVQLVLFDLSNVVDDGFRTHPQATYLKQTALFWKVVVTDADIFVKLTND